MINKLEIVMNVEKSIIILSFRIRRDRTINNCGILRRCHIETVLVGLKRSLVEGSHGIKVIPDKFIDEVEMEEYDAIICPGGSLGFKHLRDNV